MKHFVIWFSIGLGLDITLVQTIQKTQWHLHQNVELSNVRAQTITIAIVPTKGRRHYRMPSEVTISQPRDHHFNVMNGR